MPRTKLAQKLRGPTNDWFGGMVGSHLRLMGLDQMDLPGRSAPTWRKYIRNPGTMSLSYFVQLLDILHVDDKERHTIFDNLCEDIRKESKK